MGTGKCTMQAADPFGLDRCWSTAKNELTCTFALHQSTYFSHKKCLIGIEEHCAVPLDFPDRPSTAHFVDVREKRLTQLNCILL